MRIVCIVIICLIFCSCNTNQDYEFYDSRFLMDTFCEIKLVSNINSTQAKKIFSEVFHKVEEIDKEFGFTKDSVVTKINQLSGKSPCNVSTEAFELIKECIEISELTDGAFDITTGVLSSLWGFENFSKKESFNIPSEKQIKSVLPLVGYKKISVDEKTKTVFLKYTGMKLNLGGVAKGYAIRKAKEILENKGFKNFIINFGGDLYISGVKHKGKPWKIAVQHPRDKNKFLCILELSDISCATSGDYERFFEVEGKRYHHIFNPKTGYPKENIVSVTVLCKDPVLADALATGIFVLGEVKGLELANKLGIECIIVKEDNKKLKIYTTDTLRSINFNL
ncbi:MAG: FAD:protein FMN transferase [Elusimicrobiota bacterium]|nr:FAD:protein FMN transferase [Elusimicrobiota bacterium]